MQGALEEISALADTGNADAQLELGYRYFTGRTVAKDLPHAFSLFQQAATAGQADAQYEVAVRLERGWGVAKDADQALGWHRSAASQNHARAAKAAARLEAERATKAAAEEEREADEAAKVAFKTAPLLACEAAVAQVSEAARGRGLSVHEAERRETAQEVCILSVAENAGASCNTFVGRLSMDEPDGPKLLFYCKAGRHNLASWSEREGPGWVYPHEDPLEDLDDFLSMTYA